MNGYTSWKKDLRRKPATPGPGPGHAPRPASPARRSVCPCGRPVRWVGSIDDGHWEHA